jgi:hypothetical protein
VFDETSNQQCNKLRERCCLDLSAWNNLNEEEEKDFNSRGMHTAVDETNTFVEIKIEIGWLFV